MSTKIKDTKFPIVILHGWRVEGSRYNELKVILEKNGFKVFAPDMPGSGDEKMKKDVMNIDDYINFVLNFLNKQKLNKVIFICHSFGGRVGAKLAARYPEKVEKLILTGTPLIKQPLSLRKRVIVLISKLAKKILKQSFGKTKMRKILYYLLGEWDYYKVPESIRETFKAVVSEDIYPNLQHIKSPTIVIWGQKDNFVPRSVGIEIAKKIPNAKYIEVPNATHKLPYEKPEEFAKLILDFIK